MRTQEHRKDRPDSRRALDLEKSAMMVENVLDDSQAEPGTAHLAGARRVDPVKAFGQPGQVLAWYALSLIAHGYADHCVLGAAAPQGRPRAGRRPERDFGPGAPVFDRI